MVEHIKQNNVLDVGLLLLHSITIMVQTNKITIIRYNTSVIILR